MHAALAREGADGGAGAGLGAIVPSARRLREITGLANQVRFEPFGSRFRIGSARGGGKGRAGGGWTAGDKGPALGLGMLFTNANPLTGDEYATRRASGDDERREWAAHLRERNIATVSPGLLYLSSQRRGGGAAQAQAQAQAQGGTIRLCLVPKTESGSVWTPHNRAAVEFTKRQWQSAGVK